MGSNTTPSLHPLGGGTPFYILSFQNDEEIYWQKSSCFIVPVTACRAFLSQIVSNSLFLTVFNVLGFAFLPKILHSFMSIILRFAHLKNSTNRYQKWCALEHVYLWLLKFGIIFGYLAIESNSLPLCFVQDYYRSLLSIGIVTQIGTTQSVFFNKDSSKNKAFSVDLSRIFSFTLKYSQI